MMSSEEESPPLLDCSSSSPSKCLSSSSSSKKRVRQRVDAGEPRNSYASIPNFSSRPPCSPLSALYSNGYVATKMLADLLGSANNRQQQEMIVLEGGGGGIQRNGGGMLNGFSSKEGDFDDSSSSASDSSHLLRDILQQGRDSHAPATPEADRQDSEQPDMSTPPPQEEVPSPTPTVANLDSVESKRARVETIVSNMVPKTNGIGVNGSLQPQVNGCKKRKLYQPQQRDNNDEDEDDESQTSPAAKRRNGGVFTFKQQLRHMQQQLVAMQQQYMEMVDGESTDDEERPKSRDSDAGGLKPVSKTEVLDYDEASMYDNNNHRPLSSTPAKAEKQRRVTDQPPADYEWLAESLKAELSTSLSQVVDAVVSRCRKALHNKTQNDTVTAGQRLQEVQQEDKDQPPTMLLSQMLDRKSPRTSGGGNNKVIDRGMKVATNGFPPFYFPPLKPPPSVAATAAFLYGGSYQHQQHSSPPVSPAPEIPEQTEAMSLVVASKKKRHKVTDTRLRQQQDMLGDTRLRQQEPLISSPTKYGESSPQMYHHPPPPLVPVSLPTSVAIPNPSLVVSPASIFHSSFEHHFGGRLHFPSSLDQSQRDQTQRGEDLTPLHHHPLMSTPFHRGSPDYHHHLKGGDSADMSSDNGGDSPANYGDNGMAMISFMPSLHTSTLTPMHLRKAKLMFFFARYPSSAVLKMYFPDIRFNKNNTAQLVKWFSNFREFFYIQMEKYARQAITEGVKSSDELKVTPDSELLRVLNLHYNRNNHIPSPEQFRYVVEQTLREFYKALVAGKDSEQSWKKSIYKIIARMDDSVPDYFKSPNFLDTLE